MTERMKAVVLAASLTYSTFVHIWFRLSKMCPLHSVTLLGEQNHAPSKQSYTKNRAGAKAGGQLHPQPALLFCKDLFAGETVLNWVWGKLALISATLSAAALRWVSSFTPLQITFVLRSFLCPWVLQEHAVSLLSPDSWGQLESRPSLLMFRLDSGI